jgi:hypothetical protein
VLASRRLSLACLIRKVAITRWIRKNDTGIFVGSGYYLFIVLVGFKLGSLAFMAAFVAVEVNVLWYKMLVLLLGIFHKFLNVFWPLGFLGDFLEEYVPWMF